MHLAELYQIDRLVHLCAVFLSNNLTIQNVAPLVQLSSQIACTSAYGICIDFICHNPIFFGTENAKSIGMDLYQQLTQFVLGKEKKAF